MPVVRERMEGLARHGQGVCLGRCRKRGGEEVGVGLDVLSLRETPTQSIARVECSRCHARWRRIVCLGVA